MKNKFKQISSVTNKLGFDWIKSIEIKDSDPNVMVRGTYSDEIKKRLLEIGFEYICELKDHRVHCFSNRTVMIFLTNN
jgi:hypothetical protein